MLISVNQFQMTKKKKKFVEYPWFCVQDSRQLSIIVYAKGQSLPPWRESTVKAFYRHHAVVFMRFHFFAIHQKGRGSSLDRHVDARLSVNLDIKSLSVVMDYGVKFGEWRQVYILSVPHRTSVAYEHFGIPGGIFSFQVTYGKYIGIGCPTVGIYPWIHVHKSAVGKLVYVYVGNFAPVVNTESYPVRPLAPFYDRKIVAAGCRIVFQDDGCDSFHIVSDAGKMEAPVGFGAV